MKIIVVNRKKLKIVCILFLLMISIFGVGELIKGQLNPVSFMQNDIKGLKKYTALDGKFSYELPAEWTCKTKSFPGNQIIYHNEFMAKDMSITGFVQVWKDKGDLKRFLENSKEASEKANKIKKYKIKKLELEDKKGYYIRYIMDINEKEYIANEYFIKYDNGFIRFSFFNKKENYKGDMNTLYTAILKTIQLK
ncbi:conserved membrane-associated protein [Clostridium botulinum C str. Eklund]|nr:conserved membrane-associated protein [Clostridium botulinum C str. Eklund]NEZ49056.1 hypothetical protein [Clostridium botulinum]